MKSKKIIVFFSFLCIAIAVLGQNYKDNQRERYNFNSNWELHIGDFDPTVIKNTDVLSNGNLKGTWKPVTLPAAFNEDEAFRLEITRHTDTIVWYRKHFKLPETANNQKVFLEFEGIRFGGEFFLNGKSLGWHENGVMAFGFDISDKVNYTGDNVLMARIDNSWQYREHTTGSGYQWNDRRFNANYGGIPKNVFLHITPRLYQTLPLYSNLQTTGTYIYAQDIDINNKTAQLCAETQIRNEFGEKKHVDLQVVVQDRDGKIVKTFKSDPEEIAAGETKILKVKDKVSDLNFWSWGYGYLYNVYTIVSVNGKQIDVVKTTTGFRKTEFNQGTVWLNDRALQIKGYAERSSNEWPAQGMSVPAWLSDYSNHLMVESNANTVRWMHVTPWKQDVESCDRVGLIELMPAGDAEGDITGRKWVQRLELMRDAIIYNRNNPSVIFYEGGNESISEEHMSELKAIRDKYDPCGGRAIGSREMLDSKVAEYGGEMLYVNKSAKKPMFSTEYCRDEALRKYWDNYSYPFHKDGDGSRFYCSIEKKRKDVDASIYNRNQDSFVEELVTRWWDYFRVRPGTGDRVSSGGIKIHFHDSNTFWRGQENYRRSGVVDAMRIPKDAFYAQQVMWNGWVDTENQGTYICGHWQQPYNAPVNGQAPTLRATKDVQVVSTGEKVELFVNDKSQGFGERSSGFLFKFKDVKWESGSVEAVSYDNAGNILSRTKKETAGEPTKITLKLMTAPDGFKADGSDLALVEVEVVDDKGRRCPLDNSMIDFHLEGNAEWRGGIAQGKDGNYILEKQLPVECGINRVLLRSTKQAGSVKLTASVVASKSSASLQSATLEFSSKDYQEKDGLSSYIPADHLQGNLSKGATPESKSFTIKRHSVKIASATAGSNETDVIKSYDDNELSEWKNNGKLSTAWIKYKLEHDANVNEVELKLTGWRIRSYPIQIFVDDTKVWEGVTEKSLGYINIPFKPTFGRYVTIKLTGATEDKDAFGGIVEVAAKSAGELDLEKDPDAAKSKGLLRIDEAEVYEAK